MGGLRLSKTVGQRSDPILVLAFFEVDREIYLFESMSQLRRSKSGFRARLSERWLVNKLGTKISDRRIEDPILHRGSSEQQLLNRGS